MSDTRIDRAGDGDDTEGHVHRPVGGDDAATAPLMHEVREDDVEGHGYRPLVDGARDVSVRGGGAPTLRSRQKISGDDDVEGHRIVL